jgi:hypothetical protein
VSQLFACILFLGAINLFAGSEKQFVGTWEGKLTFPGGALRLVLHVEQKADGSLSGSVDSPDQGANGLPANNFTATAASLSFEVPSVHGAYSGTLSADKKTLNGKWTQGGHSLPLDLSKASPAEISQPEKPKIDSLSAKPFIGLWEGKLALPSVSLRIVLHITYAQGALTASLDSPDQGVKGIAVNEVTLDGKKITAKLAIINGSYTGQLCDDGTTLTGSWTQAGNTTILDLKKIDKVSELKRPQEPKRPFPYNEEDVTIENKKAGVTLAGTLTWPKEGKNFPVLVFVTGSGPQNRDEELLGHKPFLVISDYLARHGIASLRYDDRGIAKSTGSFAAGTTLDFADDALAAVAYLKTRKEINPEKIGVIGHSEGGLIAPIVASQSNAVAFIIMLAGTGVPGDEIINEQSTLIMRASGVGEADIRQSIDFNKTLFAIIREKLDSAATTAKLDAATDAFVAGLPDSLRANSDYSAAALKPKVKQMMSPWMHTFLMLDPRPYLRKVHCPVLVMNGSKDLQVPPYQNIPEIKKALDEAGNRQVVVKELPGLNHLFQTAKTGSPNEYAAIEETIAPEALETILAFLVSLK